MTMDAHAHSLPALGDEHGLSPAAEKTVSWGTSGLLHIGGGLLLIAITYAATVNKPKDSDVLIPPTVWSETSGLTQTTERVFSGRGDDPLREPLQNLTKDVPPQPGIDPQGVLNGMLGELTGRKGEASDPLIAIGGGRGATGGTGDLDGSGVGRRAPYGPYTGGGVPMIYKLPSFGAKKIVFVLDHSGSMLDTFDFLRQEVHRVTAEFLPVHQFSVVMFSEHVTVLGPEKLQMGLVENKREMLQKLDQIRASGENDDLLEPFQLAIGKALTMKPEMIIFLTDGKFDARLPDVVRGMNKPAANGRKAIINTIAFVKIDPGSAVGLQQIARESGGNYKFVADKDLSR